MAGAVIGGGLGLDDVAAGIAELDDDIVQTR
jgi:hypothetical protein